YCNAMEISTFRPSYQPAYIISCLTLFFRSPDSEILSFIIMCLPLQELQRQPCGQSTDFLPQQRGLPSGGKGFLDTAIAPPGAVYQLERGCLQIGNRHHSICQRLGGEFIRNQS